MRLVALFLGLFPFLSFANSFDYQTAKQETARLNKTLQPLLSKNANIVWLDDIGILLENHAISEQFFKKNKGQSLSLVKGNVCYISVLHASDDRLLPNIKAVEEASSLHGQLSLDEAFWFSFYHEYGHCIQNVYWQGDHRDVLRRALHDYPKREEAIEWLSESFSDVYAALKIEQRHLRDQHGFLSPTVAMAIFVRNLLAATDERNESHNSTELMSFAMNVVLSEPDYLMAASDLDIADLAFNVIKQREKFISKSLGLNDLALYPSGYVDGLPSVRQYLSKNDGRIDHNVDEGMPSVYRNSELGYFMRHEMKRTVSMLKSDDVYSEQSKRDVEHIEVMVDKIISYMQEQRF